MKKKKVTNLRTLELLCIVHYQFCYQLLKDLSQPHYRDRNGKKVIPSGLYEVVSRFLAWNNAKLDSNTGTTETNPLKALRERFESTTPEDDLGTAEEAAGVIEDDDEDDFLNDHEGVPEA